MPRCWDHDEKGDCCSDDDHCDGLDNGHCNGHFDVDTVPHKHPCHKKQCNSIQSMKSLSQASKIDDLQGVCQGAFEDCYNECQSCVEDCDECALKLSFGGSR